VDLADPAALNTVLRGKSFTHVFDNFAKDVKTVETVAGKAKSEWKVQNYVFFPWNYACASFASSF
jgi:hypothetical protein